jgi:hypothetical protein
MAEDTETRLTEKIKNRNCLHYNCMNLEDIQKNSILLVCVRYIDHDERNMKKDILTVSELLMHNTSSEIFVVLNGFSVEIALESVLRELPVLQVEIQV